MAQADVRLSAALLLAGLWAPLDAQQSTLPTISAAPSTAAFSYQIGATQLPAAQTAAIKRSGSGTALDFTITVPGSAPWLIVSPLTGRTGSSVTVRVNPMSLLAGTYTAAVQIDAVGASGPAVLTVTLVVKNPPPTMVASPGTLSFSYDTDQTTAPSAQAITISTSGEPVSFTAAAAGGTWLTIDRDSGIAVAGSPVIVNVSVDTNELAPGSYSGKVTLTSSNAFNKTATITVSLTVRAGTAVITSIWPNAAPVGSDDLTITIRGRHLFKSSTVTAGGTTLAATWIGTTVLLAVVPKTELATQGTLAVVVTNSPKPASNSLNFDVTAPGPRIQSVVNAASFDTGNPQPTIAPGEIISIFGSGLGPAALLQASPSNGVYLATLGTPATVVEFELTANTWTAAPIIFAQASQINAVAPFDMTPGTGRKLRVIYNSITSSTFSFDAVAADPGLFTVDSSGRGQAAALNYNPVSHTYSINSASNAVAKGSIVCLYLTGGGVMNPAPAPEGQVIPLTGQAPALMQSVSVTIAGDGASVQSATAVPGSIAGLVQINVTVPSSIRAARDHAVVVTIGGRSSSGLAAIAVK